MQRGQFTEARPALEVLSEQDPDDQFALYYLARTYEEAGERDKAAENYEKLRYFKLEEGGKIPGYLGGLVAKLGEYGISGRQEVVNIVSFLVWQEEWGEVEEVLARMGEKYPYDPEWAFYRGEMYHRRGKLEEALRRYERAIELDPQYAEVYLRIGMVYEEKALTPKPEAPSPPFEEAAKWYAKYHALAPDDLLGLKKLVEICEELERAGIEPETLGLQPKALREELARRTDDRRIVAELLSVPVEAVELGENLVENGGFEVWRDGRPEGWAWSNMATGDPCNLALFVGGVEEFEAYEGHRAMRVDGFWIQRKPELEGARAGYWGGEIELKPDRPYVLSFYYRTRNLREGEAAIWVSYDAEVLFSGDHMLPDTEGEWRKFVIIGWNRKGEMGKIKPLLRSWGVGDIWFDGVRLEEVAMKPQVGIEEASTVFQLR